MVLTYRKPPGVSSDVFLSAHGAGPAAPPGAEFDGAVIAIGRRGGGRRAETDATSRHDRAYRDGHRIEDRA